VSYLHFIKKRAIVKMENSVSINFFRSLALKQMLELWFYFYKGKIQPKIGAVPSSGKPEPKRDWIVREITNYKAQIPNKLQLKNPKLQNQKSWGKKLSVNILY
jgi:hypothetical protein